MLLSSTQVVFGNQVGGSGIHVRGHLHNHNCIETTCLLMAPTTNPEQQSQPHLHSHPHPQPVQQPSIIVNNRGNTMSDPRISIQSLISKDSSLNQNQEPRDPNRTDLNQDQQHANYYHKNSNNINQDNYSTKNMNSVPPHSYSQIPQTTYQYQQMQIPMQPQPQHQHQHQQPMPMPMQMQMQEQHRFEGGYTPTAFQTYLGQQQLQAQPRPWYAHNPIMHQQQPQQFPHLPEHNMAMPHMNMPSMDTMNTQRPMTLPTYQYQPQQQQPLNPIYMPAPMQDMGNKMYQDTASALQPFPPSSSSSLPSFPFYRGSNTATNHNTTLNMPLPPLSGQTFSHPADRAMSPGTVTTVRTLVTAPELPSSVVGAPSGGPSGLYPSPPAPTTNEPTNPPVGISISSGSKSLALPMSGITPSTNPALRKRRSRKSTWMQEEDDLLLCCVTKHGQSWSFIANKYFSGSHNRQFVRTAGQLRTRYVDHLEPDRKIVEWSDNEEIQLLQLHETYGNKWKEISEAMVGRSANDVKNRFRKLERNRRKRKRRMEQGLFGGTGGAGTSRQPDGMDSSERKNDKSEKDGDDSDSYDGSEDEESKSSIHDEHTKKNPSASASVSPSASPPPSASASVAGPSSSTI
eukprot:CAMPEP_0184692292 /NCGR_PEP_ID=MMETSP0313-20130426/834_1 /TAXON_ID=2792 /ORGANISM="Porphyridium aerugineum, Strain SAG 1380-2" /LENGTH=627 /DNA_ID=CAMNT_0027150117 /DNA_START=170 /DNA_END=2056 /DNA_ORIENTATION=+